VQVARSRSRRRAPLRVHAGTRTLKDLFVQRGKTEATDVWALRDISVEVGRGEAVGSLGNGLKTTPFV
jgi:ABC-type polysaccharide/polyol phosphate transport system ATPase subunit